MGKERVKPDHKCYFVQIAKNNKYDQVSVNKGIRRHGDKALEALSSEFSQIHNHDTFSPQMASKLTAEQRKEPLQLITMIRKSGAGK